MNILVLGAGAIGSLYGAKLSKLNEVTVIAREDHASKINKHGLKVAGIEKGIYKIKAATKIKKIENNTLILLTTKAYDSKNAINGIKNLIRKDTVILCLQNGLDIGHIAKKIVGSKCLVLRGITNFGAAFLEPGTIQYNYYGYTSIGKSGKSNAIAYIFNKCGLNCYIPNDIQVDVWKKLILNCVMNPLTAILRIENRKIVDKHLDPLKRLIIDECLRVAKKEGIEFNIDLVKMINKGSTSRNLSSMLQDLLKGKKTEIDYLNGAVVNFGKKYNVKCPVNEALVMIIKEMEKKAKMHANV